MPEQKGIASVRITGTASVEQAYQSIRDGAESMTGTQQAIANLLVPAARSLAPKRTGLLAGSIGASASATGVRLAAGAVYGGVIEWGWAARGIQGRHYLNRAAMANQERIRLLWEQGLVKVCEQAQAGA